MSEHEIKEKLHEVEFELTTVITMLVLGLIAIIMSGLSGIIFVIILAMCGLGLVIANYIKKKRTGD